MKTLFVTGASGFLGGHFLREMAGQKVKLRLLARSLKHRKSTRLQRWIQGDLSHLQPWKKHLKGCDTLIHLATVPMLKCADNPDQAMKIMLFGFKNLLDAATQAGVQRVILASTGEIYGTPPHLPVSEDTRPSPLSYYGFLKLCAEQYAQLIESTQGLSLCILRFVNLYGVSMEGEIPSSVVKNYLDQVHSGSGVILHASHRNSRDFLHVHDAACAVVKALQKPGVHGVFNIGSGRETPLKTLAREIATRMNCRMKIDFRPNEGRYRRMRSDIRRARKKLGFRPKVSLAEGLDEVLDAFFHLKKGKRI